MKPRGETALHHRATRIVATIGPASQAPGVLERLLRAGVDVVRVNGAHCRPGDITALVARVRRAERAVRRPVGVLLDLGGPKIRVVPLAGGVVEWKTGQSVEIVPGAGRGEGRRIRVSYPALLRDVHPGAEIRIDDGRIRLRVTRRGRSSLSARVMVGGRVRGGAGVNFPHSELSAPALTVKDRRDLKEGVRAGVDFLGLSFVRSAAHVRHVKTLVSRGPRARRPWVVAKIERPEAVRDLVAIASESDVLMVARGDLGVELGLAAVPMLQHEILSLGRALAVPVIVATQMLETMISSATPTRAEVSDVAGAVHDGADAVMLSGETATGSFPLQAVRVMSEIACAAEAPGSWDLPGTVCEDAADDIPRVITETAIHAAELSGARALVVYTESGRTARILSKNSLSIPIVALTPSEEVRRKMSLLRHVVSFRIPLARSLDAMLASGDRVLRRMPALAGEMVVEVSGAAREGGLTNTLRVRRL
ncbi:MAG: pyruvate kinase [Candidatus Eisenbacteria bacterium]|nr:pyruvate kinase [Candidatus Eisenbacteria bacterium]